MKLAIASLILVDGAFQFQTFQHFNPTKIPNYLSLVRALDIPCSLFDIHSLIIFTTISFSNEASSVPASLTPTLFRLYS
jgi:hypothetical protein